MSYSDELTPELIDCGKRAADIVNAYLHGLDHDEYKSKFIAIRLADGGSDGVLYDSKKDAVKHQMHEQQCYYVGLRNLINGANAKELAIMIKFQRDVYDAGMRLVDPDDQYGGQEALMTAARHDQYRQLRVTMDMRERLSNRIKELLS